MAVRATDTRLERYCHAVPDPAKAHLLLLSVAERFSSLADNAQAFMSALRRAIDFSDGDVDGFLAALAPLVCGVLLLPGVVAAGPIDLGRLRAVVAQGLTAREALAQG